MFPVDLRWHIGNDNRTGKNRKASAPEESIAVNVKSTVTATGCDIKLFP
jgi:hypothetical protein